LVEELVVVVEPAIVLLVVKLALTLPPNKIDPFENCAKEAVDTNTNAKTIIFFIVEF
jgi:hypothetical protein